MKPSTLPKMKPLQKFTKTQRQSLIELFFLDKKRRGYTIQAKAPHFKMPTMDPMWRAGLLDRYADEYWPKSTAKRHVIVFWSITDKGREQVLEWAQSNPELQARIDKPRTHAPGIRRNGLRWNEFTGTWEKL